MMRHRLRRSGQGQALPLQSNANENRSNCSAPLATGDYLVKLKANDEAVANDVLRIIRQ
jgi:hypothetical protein